VDSLNQLNGSIDILDVDHWIMGQDWGELSVSDIKVFLLKGDSAAVEFQLHNLGNMINVVLDMVHEDGEWKIDNFTDITNGMDWKATMKRYLEDEQANR
jgi:stress response protein SCP2